MLGKLDIHMQKNGIKTLSWYSHYGEQYGGSLKTKKRTTMRPSNPTTGHIPRENHNSKRHMHPNVHWSTIYNSQVMETT